MIRKPLDGITLADIESYAAEKIPERKTVEYKGAFYRLDKGTDTDKHDQHVEMLKDISSFANSLGGDLLIGVSAKQGIPEDVCGFETADPDGLKLRIHELVQRWIEPRIGFSIHSVPRSEGRHVFIIRISQSVIGPHRVIYKQSFGEFYGRNSAGVYSMDTSELRQAFALSERINDQIKAFRNQRVKTIVDGHTPVLLTDKAKLIYHVIPVDAFSSRLSFASTDLESRSFRLPLLGHSGGATIRFNLDGVVVFDNPYPNRPSMAYTQIFRNGIIEAVADETLRALPNDANQTMYFDWTLIKSIVVNTKYYVDVLKDLGVAPPVWCLLTLTNAKGFAIYTKAVRYKYPCDRDIVNVPEVQLTDLTKPDYFAAMRPMFDALWNAAGHARCTLYRDNGTFDEHLGDAI